MRVLTQTPFLIWKHSRLPLQQKNVKLKLNFSVNTESAVEET